MPSKPTKRNAGSSTPKKPAKRPAKPAPRSKKPPARGSSTRWPFADPPSLAVISLKRIFKQGKPVFYVSHDADGGWQFLDGEEVTQKDAAIVGLDEMIAHDPTLIETATLPRGFSNTVAGRQGGYLSLLCF